MTQMNLTYETEADSQTLKTNLWLPKGKVEGRDKQGVPDWLQMLTAARGSLQQVAVSGSWKQGLSFLERES